MPSQITTIATAVTATLNAATLSQSFTAVRTYLPDYDTVTVSQLKLFVLGLESQISNGGRTSDHFDYTIKVAVVAPVMGASQTADMDTWSGFTEEVVDLFRLHRTQGGAVLVGVANLPAYDAQQLQQNSLWVSVIALTFRTIR